MGAAALTPKLTPIRSVSPRPDTPDPSAIRAQWQGAGRTGTPLPRAIGAPATRALRNAGVTTLEQVPEYTPADLLALHGVGPIAIERLGEALVEHGLRWREA